jgi:WD40 repeat protein
VVAIAFSPDDALLAGGSNDKVVHVWDVKTGQERFNFIGHAGEIYSVGFAAGGTRLVSSAADNSVRVWNVAVHDESYALATSYQGSVTEVALSPSGRQLASVGQGERKVRLWDPATGRALFDLEGHRNSITALAYRPDGKRLATSSADGSIKIWDLEKRQQAVTWSTGPGRGMVIGLAFSPDGNWVAGACQDGTVKTWDAESGRLHATLRGRTSAVRCVAFSPDGKRLASGAYDHTATIWDLQTGRVLQTLTGHTNGPVCGVVFSPDGKRVATAAGDGTARIWNADTGTPLFVLKGHAMTPLTCLALNADGDRLATGSGADQSVKIWDTQTGQEMLTMKGHTGGVNCLSFSRESNLLASGSADHTIRIWNGRPLPPQKSPWLLGVTQDD